MTSILFVCLGNICRSPLAEGALRNEVERRGLRIEVDSAGTGGWHEGQPPDPRAIAAAGRNGVDISGLRARTVTPDDFRRFDHIIALDRSNLRVLREVAPWDATAAFSLMLDHVPGREGQSVADPYYGDDEDFDITWGEVSASVAGILARVA
ncbi:low molecular weight protein-tyrosine-phosphatase [Brevundimonas aveniformis]|uniref:low molecular weight protein-tyrosine-phosphatase n=1 Tax=Brevundimonas aveniformis TaxID=370977 RepID=UPI00040BEEBC|nr:low molecular weight protein-tyrosine-phosphatase [Brevundimonas aveniformis]